MDGDDLELEAFEANLRAIIRAREICNNAALVPYLRLKASDTPRLGESSDDDAQREPQCGTSSHSQLDFDNSTDDL